MHTPSMAEYDHFDPVMEDDEDDYIKHDPDTKLSPSQSPLGTAIGGAPRRPPRKSTLTQQQKNQKRQRATQDQLSMLEMEFNKNPTPSASVRERIAQEINMTERSVQIWFQNRFVSSEFLERRSNYS